MASIRQVAKQAGVSIATVSRVINGADSVAPDLRSNVMKAVEACDYTPGVGRRSLDSIALIYTGPFSVGSPYDAACIDGIVEAMRSSKYDLSIVDLARDKTSKETLKQFFARKGIRGAVLRSTAEERELVRGFAAERLPLVSLGDHFADAPLPCIFAESSTASQDAVEHLVALGHQRIAFIACDREDGDHRDRFEAYKTVLDSYGLYDQTLASRVPASRLDGAQLIRGLMGMRNRPTGLFIADPLVAVGAINEAHAMGIKIPEELSIVGFDDTDIRNSIYPKMTAVCQDSRMLGQLAFETARRLADANGASTDATSVAPALPSAWLEFNHTTAPPPSLSDSILPSGQRVKQGTQAESR